MQKEIEIAIAPEDAGNDQLILKMTAAALKIQPSVIHQFKILKRSIDARSRKVVYRFQVRAYINESAPLAELSIAYPKINNAKTVIIVGAGPAGLFAALQCLQNGLKPIVIERGKDVKQRRRD